MKRCLLALVTTALVWAVGPGVVGCDDRGGSDRDGGADGDSGRADDASADAGADARADAEGGVDARTEADVEEDAGADADEEPVPCEPAALADGDWTLSQIDVIGGAPIYPDIAVGPDGLPVVAYTKGTSTARFAAVSRYDGTSWSAPEIVEQIEGRFLGKRPSLVIDSAGALHVVAYDEDDWRLRYATDAGGSWVAEALYEEGVDAGDHSSLAIDSLGRLHVTFLRYGDYWLVYGIEEAGTWTFEPIGPAGSEPVRAGSGSLALDSSGRPHVAIYSTSGSRSLRYAHDPGSGWIVEEVDTTADVGHYPTIAIDSADVPHIAYLRWPADSSEVRAAHRQEDGWAVDVVDTGLGITYTTGIGALRCDAMAAAYARNEGVGAQGLWIGHAGPDGGSWTTESVDDSTYVSGIDLAVDPDGDVHVVYFDETSYVLKHARLSWPEAR